MKLRVNGNEQEIPDGTTVEQLIERLGLAGAICAAEVNEQVVPRAERQSRVLSADDRVEIVTLVGGG